MTEGNYIRTVGDLLYVLQNVPPDLKLCIMQPKSWTKKQPNETACKIQSVEITPYWFNIKTLEGRS